MQYRILAAILIASAIQSHPVHATEVDNFTTRDHLQDATAYLDRMMNDAMEKAAENTQGCNVNALQISLFKPLAGAFFPTIEKWASESGYAVKVPIESSIYSSIRNKVLWNRMLLFSAFYTPYSVRIGEAIVGADKLGHFLQNGYENYVATMRKRDPKFKDIRSGGTKALDVFAGVPQHLRRTDKRDTALVLDFSNFTEEGAWGRAVDGVKSYGDIAANYEGYRFWKSFASGSNPYYECRAGRWEKVREFTWSDYVSPAWDEAVNCSEFSKSVQARVEAGIARVTHHGCPVRPDLCAEIVAKYGSKSRGIIGPKCRAAARR